MHNAYKKGGVQPNDRIFATLIHHPARQGDTQLVNEWLECMSCSPSLYPLPPTGVTPGIQTLSQALVVLWRSGQDEEAFGFFKRTLAPRSRSDFDVQLDSGVEISQAEIDDFKTVQVEMLCMAHQSFTRLPKHKAAMQVDKSSYRAQAEALALEISADRRGDAINHVIQAQY
jgi:hypothetical protein